jgi:flagellar biosynthesis protein FlhF
MKIKRFVAPDIRQAMRQVREEQGPDAVILSNRRVEGGVEIVAAVDYDETMLADHRVSAARAATAAAVMPPASRSKIDRSTTPSGAAPQMPAVPAAPDPVMAEMRAELNRLRRMMEHQLSGLAWGAFVHGEPSRVELAQRLMKLGLTAHHCKEIADESVGNDVETMWSRSLERVAQRLPIYPRDPLEEGGVIALVGPTGVGKTTTVAKLAARHVLRHGNRSVGLVSIDNYRVGAHEQLKTYGRLLDVPVRIAVTGEELGAALDDLADRRLVLIDTTGMSHRDRGLMRQAANLETCRTAHKAFLLLAATSRCSALEEVATAFGAFKPDGCILTKADESTALGGALSVAIRHAMPVAYLSDGQRVPEDLHVARAGALVSRAVDLMTQSAAVLSEDLAAFAFAKELANVDD